MPSKEVRPALFTRVLRLLPWVSLGGMVGAVALILHPSPPIAFQTQPEATERVFIKLAQLQLARQKGEPYTLTLNEAEVNAFLRESLAITTVPPTGSVPPGQAPIQDGHSSIKDVRVNLFGDQLRTYAVFTVYGRDLSLQLEGRLRVEESQLSLDPTAGKLGSLPLPRVALDNVVHRLTTSPENRDTFHLSPAVTNINVQNGELQIAF